MTMNARVIKTLAFVYLHRLDTTKKIENDCRGNIKVAHMEVNVVSSTSIDR